MSNRTLKGFFRIPDLEDNRPQYIARFGELSTEARTFSRDLRDYANKKVYPYPSIVCFSYKDEYGAQFSTNPSLDWQNYVLGIGQWIAERFIASQIPPNDRRDQFWSQLTSEFTEPVWTGMGLISQMPNTAQFMPEWISFDLEDGGYPVSTKIWLSDPVFQSTGTDGYDEWEIGVIPPADPIDLVQGDFTTVQGIVRARNNTETIIPLINQLKQNSRDANLLDPETKTVTVPIRWYDQTQIGASMIHYFTLVTWGAMGLQYENQKAAIRDYLAKNSTQTNWPKIYPELFNETDFAIIPAWENMAVKPTARDIGLFSSSVPTGKTQDDMQKYAPRSFANTDDYALFIHSNCASTSVLYRGMVVGTMGSPNNKDQKFKLTDIFPDYMHAATDQADFSRLQPATQAFIRKMNQAIDIAYSVNSNNAIATGFFKQNYNGRLFVSFVDSGWQWLVLSRMSYLAG